MRQKKSLRRGSGKGVKFWNKEYDSRLQSNLSLSLRPSDDLVKFVKWLEREYDDAPFNKESVVLDLGCGNGRNLSFLVQRFGMQGVGYDISEEAIHVAQNETQKHHLPLQYEARSIAGRINLPDQSVDLVLDMMASHFLAEEERKNLVKEIVRVLKPGGWVFYKTFLLTGDKHAERLLRDNPAAEKGSYIHPQIGVMEHVSTDKEIRELFTSPFVIEKMLKSHKHLTKTGQANKRRSVSVYIYRERY